MDGCLAWLLSLFLPILAMASGANNEWNSTTRSLSMGNVGIASAQDPTTAMFYNPAALARNKRVIAEIFNPQFEAGTGIFTIGGANLAKQTSLSKARPSLEKKPGTISRFGFSLYPNVSAQNFNFGVLASGEGGAYYGESKLHYRARYLLIPTLGLSMGTFGGRFRFGVAVRGIQLTDASGSVADGDPAAYSLNAAEGFGIGVDAGALIAFPWKFIPTLGFVARNIGGTVFKADAPFSVGTGNVTRHATIPMTFDTGFSITPKTGKRSAVTIALDYRDVVNETDTKLLQRINFGLEFDVNRTFYLRTGFGRGYWTAGIGLASKYGSLDIGTYADEWSSPGNQVKEDRRISLRYGSRF